MRDSLDPSMAIDLHELRDRLADDQYVDELKKDPKRALERVSRRTPLQTDQWIYRIVVIALGLTVLSAVIGAIYLASLAGEGQTASIPEILVAIGSAAVGALAGLLSPSPGSSSAG